MNYFYEHNKLLKKETLALKLKLLSIMLASLLFACTSDYLTTKAKITELEINYKEKGNYRATIEYSVEGTEYKDYFEIDVFKLVNDSISTPHPGTEFEILYNPDNPEQTIIDYQVKANYVEKNSR